MILGHKTHKWLAILSMTLMTTVYAAGTPMDTSDDAGGTRSPRPPYQVLSETILKVDPFLIDTEIDKFVKEYNIQTNAAYQKDMVDFFSNIYETQEKEFHSWRYQVCLTGLRARFHLPPGTPILTPAPPPPPVGLDTLPLFSLAADEKGEQEDDGEEAVEELTPTAAPVVPVAPVAPLAPDVATTSAAPPRPPTLGACSGPECGGALSLLSLLPARLPPRLPVTPVDVSLVVNARLPAHMRDVMFPREIAAKLGEDTIGQDAALRRIAIAAHRHLANRARIQHKIAGAERLAPRVKQNLLLIGPTGSGKTSSVRNLAKIFKVPVAVVSATEWTGQGYVGGKWQSMFKALIAAARGELANAEKGMIFIDEFDKLCTHGITGDEGVFYQRVQKELLTPVEGARITLGEGEGAINTHNIMFIFGGAFPGLKSAIPGQPITAPDLGRYGLIPEMAGRIGNIAEFVPMDKAALLRIMRESKESALRDHQERYRLDYNIDLQFEDGVGAAAVKRLGEVSEKSGAVVSAPVQSGPATAAATAAPLQSGSVVSVSTSSPVQSGPTSIAVSRAPAQSTAPVAAAGASVLEVSAKLTGEALEKQRSAERAERIRRREARIARDAADEITRRGALDVIATKALDMGTGARALNHMIDLVLEPRQMDLEDFAGRTLVITAAETESILSKYSNEDIARALKEKEAGPPHMYI